VAKWAIYNLTYPGDAAQGTRAAGYVSRYHEQRWQNWALALQDAERRLDIRQDDYELRQDLYQEQREMILDEIQRIATAQQDYLDGVTTAQQAVDRRNVAARNSNTRFNVGVENRQRAADASAASSAGAAAPSGPELVSPGTDVEAIAAGVANQLRQGLPTDTGAFDVVNAMRSGVGAVNTEAAAGAEMPNARQMASARFMMHENLINTYAQKNGISYDDAEVAVKAQIAQLPQTDPLRRSYTADLQLLTTPTDDTAAAPAAESPQLQRAGVMFEARPEVDPDRLALYDARKAELQAELDLLQVPTPPEEASLIEEARAAYRGAFPVPGRRRRPSGLERMTAAARARGIPVEEARAQALAAVRERMAADAAPAPAPEVKEKRARTPREEDRYQRLRMGMRGMELSQDAAAMATRDENPDLAIVRELYSNANPDKINIFALQNEIKNAQLDAGAQDMALEYLSALHAKDKTETLLSAPEKVTDAEPAPQ
jgi:hypothetical protein